MAKLGGPHCLLAIFALLHCCSCLQVVSLHQQQQSAAKHQQQHQAAAALAGAVSSGAHQVSSTSGGSGSGSNNPDGVTAAAASANGAFTSGSNPSQNANSNPNPAPAKSNIRLVNKLKDARHRRRNRHQRHRRYREKASAIPQMDSSAQAGATSLIALESIVEEVARAGQQQQQQHQLPTSPATGHVSPNVAASHQSSQPSVQQQQQQQQHQQQSPGQPQQQPKQQSHAISGTDLLLDGSSSPVSQLQPAGPPNQMPTLAASNQHQPPIPTPTTGITRGPHYNARGFFLTSMLSKIMNVLNVTEFALEMRDGISSRASCMACNAVVGLFLSPLYSKEVFSAAIRTVCTSFKIQTGRVCAGLAESFQDDFEFIRKNTKLTRDEICAVVFGVDCARRQTYNLFWTVPIPGLPGVGDKQTGTKLHQLEPGQIAEPANGLSSSSPSSSSSSSPSSSSTGLSIAGTEHAITNLDDAPDLFEYRKSSPSNLMAANNNNNNHDQSSASSSLRLRAGAGSGHDEAKQQDAKKGKMLMKRPQYIFDDDHLLESESSSEPAGQPAKISSFVHITDIHIDPYYEPGSLNDCNEPLCCRASSGLVAPGDKRRQAGQWGDYGNCDTPVRTLRSALDRIREQHSQAEYWLWTGDISPHDIWNISKAEAANHVRLVSKMVRDYSNGVPVFPVIGNHEAHPVNSFSPPEIKGKFSMSWLYDVLADEWSDWLPKDALKTLRIGGFYRLLVRKGFRILALNTNYCARLNPWSFYDPVDPANQLKWLVDELLEAELNQDKVHIIGHVPPDNRECTQAWLFNFINIVDRFKDTIIAQFYGHTHRDEWRLIYSLKRPDEPIGIQYIGPSITPFTENNPAYRVYHQDRSGFLLDSETYFFNLTEANESPANEPNWQFSYRTRTHLNMTRGLTPGEWHQYLQRLHDDDELFEEFFKRYYRSSDVKHGQVCRAKCRFQMLSDLRLSHPYKTKPKPFLANRKTSNHHRDRHDHHHHHHKRLRHSER